MDDSTLKWSLEISPLNTFQQSLFLNSLRKYQIHYQECNILWTEVKDCKYYSRVLICFCAVCDVVTNIFSSYSTLSFAWRTLSFCLLSFLNLPLLKHFHFTSSRLTESPKRTETLWKRNPISNHKTVWLLVAPDPWYTHNNTINFWKD